MSLFSKLSYKSRKQKLKLFYDLVCPDENIKILDVGAEINPSGDRGLQLIDDYAWKSNVSAINLSQQHIGKINSIYPEIDARVGDACNLPYPDKYFDVVYSNAVIEHVGSYENQKKMASEIMRVGKSWFLATPNRWYPFEFHLRLPFVTWLPWHGYRWLGKLISYNHMKKRYAFGLDTSDLCLMSAAELRKCFSGSRIIKSRITFMAENLIVFGGDKLKRKIQ
jgi:SAM-dependent methyltransferase